MRIVYEPTAIASLWDRIASLPSIRDQPLKGPECIDCGVPPFLPQETDRRLVEAGRLCESRPPPTNSQEVGMDPLYGRPRCIRLERHA